MSTQALTVPTTQGLSAPSTALVELSATQLHWLSIRMDTDSDVAATRTLNAIQKEGEVPVTKDMVRAWKRNKSFGTLLELVRFKKEEAFRVLVGGRMAGLALTALVSLLTGETPYERKEGLRAYMDIVKESRASGNTDEMLLALLRTRTPVNAVQVIVRGGERVEVIEGEIVGHGAYVEDTEETSK